MDALDWMDGRGRRSVMLAYTLIQDDDDKRFDTNTCNAP